MADNSAAPTLAVSRAASVLAQLPPLALMAHLLLGPMLLDMLNLFFGSWMSLQSVRMDVPPWRLGYLSALSALGYATGAYLAGRWITPSRAVASMVAVLLLVPICGITAILLPHFGLYLVISALIGLLAAHYYVPIQVKFSQIRPFRTMGWTVAFYNVGWGSGLVLGSALLAGLRDVKSLWAAGGVVLAVTLVHLLILRQSVRAVPPAGSLHPQAAFGSSARLRWMGWLGLFASLVCFTGMLGALWPGLGKERGLTDSQIGLGLLAASLPCAVGPALMALIRKRLGRPWMIALSLPLAAVGCLLLPHVTSLAMSMLCLLLCGTAFSVCAFHGVYYAQSDRHTLARSVGFNEVLSGLGATVGPLLLGNLAWDNYARPLAYNLAALLLLAALAGIIVLWLRADGPLSEETPAQVLAVGATQ